MVVSASPSIRSTIGGANAKANLYRFARARLAGGLPWFDWLNIDPEPAFFSSLSLLCATLLSLSSFRSIDCALGAMREVESL